LGRHRRLGGLEGPRKREASYDRSAGDRIYLTTARDLRLDEHQGRSLNYFIYRYVEVAGREYADSVRRSVRFNEIQRQTAVPNSRNQ